MPNPLFNVLGGQQRKPRNMVEQFTDFCGEMQGKDPDAMVNELVSSGKVPQGVYQQAVMMAQQVAPILGPLLGK